MGVKLGTLDITFKVGSADTNVYLGSQMIYSGDTPTPPTFQGKWIATYTGGTTESAACDASSAITIYEITLTDLESVEIGDCVTYIDDMAFRNCGSITGVTIPNSVTSIGQSPFYQCFSLTSIDMPNSVTYIGLSAFYGCSGLTTVTIGSGVTSIGKMAFRHCSGLTGITINATNPPTLGDNVFQNTNDCPIYVPSASVSSYQSAWSAYSSRIQAIPE